MVFLESRNVLQYPWSIFYQLDLFCYIFLSTQMIQVNKFHILIWDEPNIELRYQSVQSLYGVWPLTASIEVKNNHASVKTQRILNKFIEVNFSVGNMVWQWCCLFQDLTTMYLINKYLVKNQVHENKRSPSELFLTQFGISYCYILGCIA